VGSVRKLIGRTATPEAIAGRITLRARTFVVRIVVSLQRR
jgi:hypothetical protein